MLISACTSASLEPSYVLRAIGADEDIAHSSIRLAPALLATNIQIATDVEVTAENYFPEVGNISNYGEIIFIVIAHLEMRACDWSKSRHVAVNKSR